MTKSITVKVRKIEDGTTAYTEEHRDAFYVGHMYPGETISVIPNENCPGWYKSIINGYNYHKSWLIFPKARHIREGECAKA
jgi:hypothetical protein